METLLEGQRALVTGAGRGIGSAIARQFAKYGASVAVSYRGSRDGAQRIVDEIMDAGGTAFALQADLTDETEAARLVAQAKDALGGLDTLVNNASGFGPLRPLADADATYLLEEWRAVVLPVVTTTRAVLPLFIEQKRGCVVNLSATLLQRPAPGQGAHGMAKSAVLSYTRTLAREVGPQGIRVNAVSPGMALTEFSQNLPEADKEAVRLRTPLRRLATPDDVASAVIFFCSPLADFITGANLAADGGLAVL